MLTGQEQVTSYNLECREEESNTAGLMYGKNYKKDKPQRELKILLTENNSIFQE